MCPIRIHIKDCVVSVILPDTTQLGTSGIIEVTETYVVLQTTSGPKRYPKEHVLNWNYEEYLSWLKECSGCCDKEEDIPEDFEKCFPFNLVLQDGECKTLQEVLDSFPGAKGVAGYDIDLKPVNGHGRDKFVATTSDATMEGPHGTLDLDGGGSNNIKPERLPDGTYNRVDLSQKFCSCPGSVVHLGISIIL